MSILSTTARLRSSAALVLACTAAAASAQEMHHQHGAAVAGKAPLFVASTAKPFSALMNDAMLVMDDGMQRAPMNGVSEHDFMTMMIPHHQGAVDMAKALLLYTNDPAFRNLVQGIITEQQNEIRVMQAWLERYQPAQTKAAPASVTRKE
jgi:uncharacterized protein (DUF305 family)